MEAYTIQKWVAFECFIYSYIARLVGMFSGKISATRKESKMYRSADGSGRFQGSLLDIEPLGKGTN